MSKTSLWVLHKKTGVIHEVGSDPDDVICMTDGTVRYYNKGSYGSCWNSTKQKEAYVFLPSLFGEVLQPDSCVLDLSHCGYPIMDCKNCPIRDGTLNGTVCQFE